MAVHEIIYEFQELKPFKGDDDTPVQVIIYGDAIISYSGSSNSFVWAVKHIDLPAAMIGGSGLTIDGKHVLFAPIVNELLALEHVQAIEAAIQDELELEEEMQQAIRDCYEACLRNDNRPGLQ